MIYLYIFVIIVLFLLIRRTAKVYKKYSSSRYPAFFYRNISADRIGIPVFTYHSIGDRTVPDSITIKEFTSQMQYLAKNGYSTLSIDEFFDHIVHGIALPPKSVLLTFDDGRASLWTYAFPILQEFNHKAVCFLVPSKMSKKGVRPTLDKLDNGKTNIPIKKFDIDLSENPMITWEEAREMKNSGLLDFQSHTYDHTLIYTSSEIVDFIHPQYRYGYSNFKIPTIHSENVDFSHKRMPLGTPIYKNDSRMGAARRFFDDERLRNACIDWVQQNGAEELFKRIDWKNLIMKFVSQYINNNNLNTSYETHEDQVLAIRTSLEASKNAIELNLPGQTVRYLAFPWNYFSVLSASIAKDLGYLGALIDINPKKLVGPRRDSYFIDREIPINETGDDPYLISRIDARNDLLLSLPGKDRLTFSSRIMDDFLEPPYWLKVRR